MENTTQLFFKISLAQWSFHKTIFSGQLPVLDFAEKARAMDFDAVEYVSRFYMKQAQDSIAFSKLIKELKTRSDDNGITNLLIMVDGEGALASADGILQNQAIDNHIKWLDAAAALGCHSIRVNLTGGPEHNSSAWKTASAEGLVKLATIAKDYGLNVLVENHGGLSSNGVLLAEVIQLVDLPNCGTLPDFGNFCIRREGDGKWPNPCVKRYDRYKGVAEMMPFAKGVSAKSYDFDADGTAAEIDYLRMLNIVKESGYAGYIGIEYEGQLLSEEEGIKATRDLLLKTGCIQL